MWEGGGKPPTFIRKDHDLGIPPFKMNTAFYQKLLVILSAGEIKFKSRLIPQAIYLGSF